MNTLIESKPAKATSTEKPKSGAMKALVYHGPNLRAWEDKPTPIPQKPTDAIVKIVKTTICGSDLHIMKGDVPEVTDGRILGHEGVGIAAGGRIANIGVHGKSAELHLEKLWSSTITITTRLVDTVTTPLLLKTVRSGKLVPSKLITHRFPLCEIMKAYDTFGNAAKERALKVILTNP